MPLDQDNETAPSPPASEHGAPADLVRLAALAASRGLAEQPPAPTQPPPQAQPQASEFDPAIQRLTGQCSAVQRRRGTVAATAERWVDMQSPSPAGQNFTLAEREAFKIFSADRKNRMEVEMTKEALKAKFEEAKLAAARIKLTRKRMGSTWDGEAALSFPRESNEKAMLSSGSVFLPQSRSTTS